MAMSSGSDLSDDDRPLGAPNGSSNGRHHPNGNGHIPVQQALSSMSEDEDMPLVGQVGARRLHLAHYVSQSTVDSAPAHPSRTLKRKKPIYAESSSSEDDTPLASSPAKLATSAAIAMPGALQATTVPASSAKGKGKAKPNVSKAEVNDDEYTEDDAPKRKRAVSNKEKKPAKKKMKQEPAASGSDDDDDDKPIAAKKTSAPRKRKVKVESDADSSGDEKPLAKKPPVKKSRASKVKEESSSGDEVPQAQKSSGKVKKGGSNGSPTKPKGKKKEKEEEEEVFRWWDADANGDGSVKWQTLEHSGVIFPGPYEPLPVHVKMKYDGEFSVPPLELE